VSDPVGSGFVASIARPEGNTTGFTNFEPSLTGKWLQLLKEIAPGILRVGVLFNPKTAPGGGNPTVANVSCFIPQPMRTNPSAYIFYHDHWPLAFAELP
jgi:hypothetical protein